MAVALNRLERETDVRRVLRTVQAPTLVLHRRDEAVYRVEEGRYLARHIPGARFVELEGADHLPGDGDMSAVLEEIGRFLGSVRDEEASFDRVLASVLFTDIVGSSEKAAALGDRRWRETVEAHHATVRAILGRYHGVEIDTAGDGFFATFDGPARAVRCAQAIVEAVRALELEVRVGRPHGRGRDDRREGRRDRREHRREGRRGGGPFRGPRLLDREGPRRGVRSRLQGPR